MSAALRPDEIAQNLAELQNLLEKELTAVAPIPAPGAFEGAAAIAQWLASVRGKPATMRHPRIALFCAPQSAELASIKAGTHTIAGLTETINSDLQVYETPVLAAPNRATMLHGIAYGMTAVQPSLDLLALACLDDMPVDIAPTLEALVDSTRTDLAALCGAALAARLARVPVVGAGASFDYACRLIASNDPAAAYHMLRAQSLVGDETADAVQLCGMGAAYLKSAAALG